MRFESWYFLLPLLLIPLFHRLFVSRAKPARLRFSFPSTLKQTGHLDPTFIQLLIRYGVLVALVLALARPQTSFTVTERQVSGVDIMMVMDVSASMRAEDMAERSRLEVAKDTMQNFIRGRQSDRIGFVIFSGEPLTLAPPTLDYGLVLSSVKNAEIGVLKDGTGIGDGLSLAIHRLKDSTAKSRIIVLLTDGDNNIGQVDPLTAGELAAGYKIKVYTIAIGKEGRVRVPIDREGFFGKMIRTYQWFDNALNTVLLEKIANMTHGKFYRASEESNLNKVFQEIDQLEKSEMTTHERVNFDEQFQLPLKIGFLLLMVELAFSLFFRRAFP
jgi:Ca-activated chloride channel family protein